MHKSGLFSLFVHMKPCSILQEELQPSPSIKFPSSHSTFPKLIPSPQTSLQDPSAAVYNPALTSLHDLHSTSEFDISVDL